MTTNDTRAAIESAIDALIDAEDIDTRAVVAAEAGDKAAIDAIWTTEPIALMRRTELRAAITAHVAAEVARRLAPNLELWRWKCHDETIEQAIERMDQRLEAYERQTAAHSKLLEKLIEKIQPAEVVVNVPEQPARTKIIHRDADGNISRVEEK